MHIGRYSTLKEGIGHPKKVYTVSWNKDHGGAGHICGTSLYTASSLYIVSPKTYFLIIDTYFDVRPSNPTNGRAGPYFQQPRICKLKLFFHI